MEEVKKVLWNFGKKNAREPQNYAMNKLTIFLWRQDLKVTLLETLKAIRESTQVREKSSSDGEKTLEEMERKNEIVLETLYSPQGAPFSPGKLCKLQSMHQIFPIFAISAYHQGFPGGSISKESASNIGHLGLIPGSGKTPGEGNGNPLQYSFLKNPLDRRAWWVTVHGVSRVRHDLATKPSPSQYCYLSFLTFFFCWNTYSNFNSHNDI